MSDLISRYPLTVAATAGSYIFYGLTSLWTDITREKYKIPPPNITGHVEFENARGVQLNTLENITVSVPSLWLLSLSSENDMYGGLAGFSWIIGRILYWQGYPKNVYPGWMVTVAAQSAAYLGGTAFALKNYVDKNFK